MSIWSQRSALIQQRTSPGKFDDLAEKSEKDSVSNFLTKAGAQLTPVADEQRPWNPSIQQGTSLRKFDDLAEKSEIAIRYRIFVN